MPTKSSYLLCLTERSAAAAMYFFVPFVYKELLEAKRRRRKKKGGIANLVSLRLVLHSCWASQPAGGRETN